MGILFGVSVGIGAVYYWNRLSGEEVNFNRSLRREMISGGVEGRLHNLKTKLEEVENRLELVEEKITEDPVLKEDIAYPGEKPVLPVKEEVKNEVVEQETDVGVEVESGDLKGRDKSSRVLGLWRQGREVKEIARETGLGQGEVELILSLRNK